MAKKTLTQATFNTDNIQNQPNQVVGSASALKLAFDQASIDTKSFLNGTLISELADETLNASGSHTIGHNSASVTADNVGDAIEETKAKANTSVQTSGDQIVNGVKTFSSSPIVPTPTTANQAANKTYVDSKSPLNIADNSITDVKLVDSGGIKSAVYDAFSADHVDYEGNTKLVDDGQDETVWSGGTPTADTADKKIGSQSVKFTTTVGTIFPTYDNLPSIDLSKTLNGENSNGDDYIVVEFSFNDVANISDFKIRLSSDAVQGSNYLEGNLISLGIVNGWKQYAMKKSDFTSSGAGADLSDIQSIRFRVQATSVQFIRYQYTQLVKKDPDSAQPNPFQRNGVRDYRIDSGEWFVGLENGLITRKELSGTVTSTGLVREVNYDDFIAYGTIIANSSTNLGYFRIGKDGSNFIRLSIESDNFRVLSHVAGVPTDLTEPLPINIGDSVTFEVHRVGDSVTCKATVNNETLNAKIIKVTNGISGYQLALGMITTGQIYKNDSITQLNHAHTADKASVADSLKILYNAGVFTADTLPFGTLGIDTLNNRLYVRKDATTVSYTALT